jgi:tetratricopeptide (TPR) repeat protein
MLRFGQGRIDEAIEHLSSAVQLDPEIATAHRVLGALLCSQGAMQEGFVHLSEAVRLAPSDAAAQYLLGKALVSRGRLDEGVAHLSQAVQLDPDDAAAHFDLGTTLFRRGRTEEAIAELTSAVELDADDPAKLRELAWVLATCSESRLRDGARAVELAKRACELTGYRSIEALDVLGVCQAEVGQFAQAIRAAEQARTLAAGHPPVARAISARIELYRQGKPYRPAALP